VVSHPVMQRLIHNKWMYFGWTATILDLCFHIVFIILWTTMSMLTPPTGQELYDPLSQNVWRVVLALVICIMIIYKIGRQVRGRFYMFVEVFYIQIVSPAGCYCCSFIIVCYIVLFMSLWLLPFQTCIWHVSLIKLTHVFYTSIHMCFYKNCFHCENYTKQVGKFATWKSNSRVSYYFV
jgi:mannitol-specific phosphotransferase system IIBC component